MNDVKGKLHRFILYLSIKNTPDVNVQPEKSISHQPMPFEIICEVLSPFLHCGSPKGNIYFYSYL